MAIITKPTITKGQANEFDLSKSDLAVLSKVTSDSYFSDQANWSKVYIEYKSTEGKQLKQVVFDASEASPKGSFDISEKAKDSWEVQALVIMDFDGGYLKLERGDLPVGDMDIALNVVAGSLIEQLLDDSGGGYAGISGSTSYAGQSFQYGSNFDLTSIEVKLDHPLQNNTGTIGMSLYTISSATNSSGKSLVEQSSTNLDVTSIANGADFYSFVFTQNNLSSSNIYYYELDFNGVSFSSAINVHMSTANPYADGAAFIDSTIANSAVDCAFKIIGS